MPGPPPAKERCKVVGAGPEESHKDAQRAGGPLSCEERLRERLLSGEEKALRRPSELPSQYLTGAYKKAEEGLPKEECCDRKKDNGFKI